MILVKTTIGDFMTNFKKKLLSPEQTDKMVRTAATSVLGLMKQRIHKNGLDATLKPIGFYSKGYMVLRTGAFKNAKRTKTGKNAGKLKDAGMFTKGQNATSSVKTRKLNSPRPRYNRTNDPKIIASLTRQMENDFKVIATGPNSYGLGFSNSHNYDKSQWVEATYNKKGEIFSLSPDEIKIVENTVQKFTADGIT